MISLYSLKGALGAPRSPRDPIGFASENLKKKKALPSGLQCFLMKTRPKKTLIPKLRPKYCLKVS